MADQQKPPVNNPTAQVASSSPKDNENKPTPPEPDGKYHDQKLGCVKVTAMEAGSKEIAEGAWIELPGEKTSALSFYRKHNGELVLGVHGTSREVCDFAICVHQGQVLLQTTSQGETLCADLHNIVKRHAVVVPLGTPSVPIRTQ